MEIQEVKTVNFTPEMAKELLSTDIGLSRSSAGSVKVIDALAESMLKGEWEFLGKIALKNPSKKYRSIDDPWEET